jgi:hypothetical protein
VVLFRGCSRFDVAAEPLSSTFSAVQAHRRVPLGFPGSLERWLVCNDFVDSMFLAKMDVWAGTTGKCGGEWFNASNGS